MASLAARVVALAALLLVASPARADHHQSDAEPIEPEEALEQMVKVDYEETELSDVAADLGQQSGVDIIVDGNSIADEGVSQDETLSLTLSRPVPLREASELLLDGLGLTIVADRSVLRLVSQTEAEEMTSTRVYDVTDLIGEPSAGDGTDEQTKSSADASPKEAAKTGGGPGGSGSGFFAVPPSAASLVVAAATPSQFGGSSGQRPRQPAAQGSANGLIALIQSHTSGPWEDIDGTGGAISPLRVGGRDMLIITADSRTHREVEELLDQIRDAAGLDAEAGGSAREGTQRAAKDRTRDATRTAKRAGESEPADAGSESAESAESAEDASEAAERAKRRDAKTDATERPPKSESNAKDTAAE